ncbi:MAG TPA: hypothetical protein VNU70_09715 [Puia sp.]|nr:hypothetical protein [Puia sp.]
MKEQFKRRLEQKAGVAGLVEILADRLSGSDLNSLLLEVFRRKASAMKPAELVAHHRQNRLVQPSEGDMVALLEMELSVLQYFREHGFRPVELSPVAAFGSCSGVATVDQQKVISAVRNTEIVADATNVLALHIAARLREDPGDREGVARLCTVHRHVRTQPIAGKGYTPHFKIGCLVNSGLDKGNYEFECQSLEEQLSVMTRVLRERIGIGQFRLLLKRRGGNEGRKQRRGGYDGGRSLIDVVCEHLSKTMKDLEIALEDQPVPNDYYKGIQFKLLVPFGGRELDIADGGFVDWTQRMLENRKERLLISGFGLELLYKMKSGML